MCLIFQVLSTSRHTSANSSDSAMGQRVVIEAIANFFVVGVDPGR